MKARIACCFMWLVVMRASAAYVCDTTIAGRDTVVTCTTKTSDGTLIAVNEYLNGEKNGVHRGWHRNGSMRFVKKYDRGCPYDTAFEFFDNGNVEAILPYSDCKRAGLRLEFSISGDTLAMGLARDGKSVGTHYAWWENGNLKFKTNFNDSGKKHGLSETWREDGTRKDSTVYDNGDIIEIRRYYNNGKLRYHKKQKPINKNINAIYYDPNGNKTGEVKNGTGTYISYSDDGTSARRVYFENDEVVKSEEVEVK